MENIFNKLPKFLWINIFEYDPTYRIIFNNCLKEIIRKIREKKEKHEIYMAALNYNLLMTLQFGNECFRFSL